MARKRKERHDNRRTARRWHRALRNPGLRSRGPTAAQNAGQDTCTPPPTQGRETAQEEEESRGAQQDKGTQRRKRADRQRRPEDDPDDEGYSNDSNSNGQEHDEGSSNGYEHQRRHDNYFEQSKTIRCITWNIRGIQDTAKRQEVEAYLEKHKIDLALIQETKNNANAQETRPHTWFFSTTVDQKEKEEVEAKIRARTATNQENRPSENTRA